ncbi:hypothetical protein N474_16375 [Pseudoalteromonas luteoviolacea CPMOR-2]|uniref:DUF998 domain-containing protein n=1 Tax=Pseudoalteromonas luteoviolacea DSM 6061 TaxID=1365250 RepID=A0A166VUP6_9GAMM|nr:DUF998 domain-containing protein [Pseudoalteromonas luteoviolacea]KZN33804.1 hypothetical protein N475_19735 [Pseudoalteromonas luteoviolacea DSM 6061]KZN55046.1 hypothetical protein N474_16375 [Pseudoalteromonas luteoviolacea CPMOR-2]
MFESISILSGLIAFIWITVGVIVAAKFYPNYNHNEQFCSELGAVGSPTQKLSPMINNYPLGALFCLFGWAIFQHSDSSVLLATTGWLVILHGIGTWVAGMFPMDKDPYTRSPSLSCQIHSWAGFIMLLSLLIAPILVAFSSLPAAFRAFSLVSVIVAVYYLVKMAQAVKLQKHVGRYQRLSYWAKLLWLAGLSLLLWNA